MNNGIFVQDSYDSKVSFESQSIQGAVGGPSIVPLPYSCSFNRWDPNKLVFVVDTRLQSSTTITFTTSNANYIIDWGDGYIDIIRGAAAYAQTRHTYTSHGTYIIQTNSINNPVVRGAFLIGILSFGNPTTETSLTYLGGGGGSFGSCPNLYFIPKDFPRHTSLDLTLSLQNASKLNDPNISLWDVSKVTSMRSLFQNNLIFNQPLNTWNTSNTTSMQNTFANALLFSQDLNNWDVSKVTNFSQMFQRATSFNSSLSGWQLVANNVNCADMFRNATNFQGIGLDSWNTSGVTNMLHMFSHIGVNSFNENISGWDVSNVTNFAFMFWSSNINLPFNQNLGSWSVSKGTTFQEMFRGCVSVSNQDLRNWNIAGVNVSNGLDNFMLGKTEVNSLSTANYDALLIGWNNNKLAAANGVANWRTDLRPHFGGSKYTAGGDAATARADLISYGWTITDGGIV